MHGNKTILLSSAYTGPLSYFAHIVQSREIMIDGHEHYIKQTYRNRCCILTSNGIRNLIIPVIRVNGNHTKIRDIEISYAEKWQLNHWRAIESAYNNSPFFLFYKEEIQSFYNSRYSLLLDFNSGMLKLFLHMLGEDREIRFSKSYMDAKEGDFKDYRMAFSPKQKPVCEFQPYMQVFLEKWGFQADLCVIDLIFNMGPEAKNYLMKIPIR